MPAEHCSATPDFGNRWVNIDGIHEIPVLERAGRSFGLHPLTVEDIANTDQRPKMEEYDEYLFVVMKMLRYERAQHGIVSEQVSLVLRERSVVSFQEGIAGDVFDPVRERIRSDKSRISQTGSDYLLYSLIDAVVDNYFIILESIGEEIEDLEDGLVLHPSPELLANIHRLKRELIFLRKSVWPLREVIAALHRGESPLISDPTRLYLRDVYDHTIQVIDTLETYRDMLSGMIDVYMSSVSNRMNEIMKVLTVIATIFIPLTFVAGVYGMNFEFMPEIKWPLGYAFAWGVMLAMAASMIAYFWRKKWL